MHARLALLGALAVTVALVFFSATGADGAAPCAADADCKRKRICRQGQCVTSVACGRDRDCPGDEICINNACSAASEEAASSAPPASSGCNIDKDCPGELVCNDRVCGPAKKASAPPARVCLRDKDCPGDDVCKEGACAAAQAAPQAATAAAKPTASPAPAAVGARFIAESAVVKDATLKIAWQKVSPEERYEYVDAQKYCSALQLGNGAGWRLPTIDELSSLSSKTLRPQVQASFPDLAGTYWSATEESRLRMWVVNLRFSTKLIQGVREKLSVRCVH